MHKLFRAALPAVLLMAGCAHADMPGRHPYYLHALSDLRDARAHLERLGNDRVDHAEEHAIHEIDAAINEIKHAAIDDGKDLYDHMPVDQHLSRTDRFHKAEELLDKAHQDVAQEEDSPELRGLQKRALIHIDEAHHAVGHVIETVLSQ